MRVEQLEYVAAVARIGSFVRAAEELHISQPALSATVRNLERELGVKLLERTRTGARVSEAGGDLLPHISAVIDAADSLRSAAGHHQARRKVRLGTVHAATSPLLAPAITAFREIHPSTQVEVVGAQEDAINRGLRDGNLDLGLVTFLGTDDVSAEFETTRLLTGRAVVCVRCDSPLAELTAISTEEVLTVPLIVMRPGYLMHRFVHLLLAGRTPSVSRTTDGAAMGKLMVADGLGAMVLPDFSVIGDPLERSGVITWRRIAGDHTEVCLAVRRRRNASPPRAARELHGVLLDRARSYQPELEGSAAVVS